MNGTLRNYPGDVGTTVGHDAHIPPPLLAGGQGRSAESIFSAAVVAALCLTGVCVLVGALLLSSSPTGQLPVVSYGGG